MAIAQIEPLATDRLSLEPLREAHADEMVAVLAHAELYEYTGGSPPDQATLATRFRAQVQGPPAGDEHWLNWVVRSRDSGVAIGFVQATVVESRADVAWVVGVESQGQGLATEAATAMVEWLRKSGAESIEAHIHPDHRASQRVAERLGLTRTGATDDDGEEIWSSADPQRSK
jgi:RimJ/RimL family protein N-acetyltransferase